jgi:DNA-binding IclR family transcriptional regulator
MRGALADQEDDAVEETWVVLAVLLGQYQGRPMDITSVSNLARIPRTSVQRHIKKLEELGKLRVTKIGRRSIVLAASADERLGLYRLAEIIIKRSAHDLTTLDM